MIAQVPAWVSKFAQEVYLKTNKKLFIVGGFVRNVLLSLATTDIDIAGAIMADDIVVIATELGYKVNYKSQKLGTVQIQGEECGQVLEYTCFREDSYPDNGAHQPQFVKFTDDIVCDAKRRDFTVNAIYFDLIDKKIVDVLNGVADLKGKTLKCAREPNKVFAEDGLRLLRLVRFAVSLGFNIDDKTLQFAKLNITNLKDIKKERVREEFNKILIADTYNAKLYGAHVKGLYLLDSMKILKYIIPELEEGKGILQNPAYHKFDVFNHIMYAVLFSPPSIRLASLFHDIAKPKMFSANGKMAGHEIEGGIIAKKRLTALKYSTKEIEKVVKLVEAHMVDLKCTMQDGDLKFYIVENVAMVEDLIELKKADFKASMLSDELCPAVDRFSKMLNKIKKDKTPLTVKDLKIDGNDLINLCVPEKQRTVIMRQLFKKVVTDNTFNTRAKQLLFIKEKLA